MDQYETPLTWPHDCRMITELKGSLPAGSVAHQEKTADVAFAVDRDASLVPSLIEDCTHEPHASYCQGMERFMRD
jgi:hypothetical protein